MMSQKHQSTVRNGTHKKAENDRKTSTDMNGYTGDWVIRHKIKIGYQICSEKVWFQSPKRHCRPGQKPHSFHNTLFEGQIIIQAPTELKIDWSTKGEASRRGRREQYKILIRRELRGNNLIIKIYSGNKTGFITCHSQPKHLQYD